ncbi:MAG: molybdopterin synthase sulfur carrier subunit [Lutibacter sp.]|nr:MAG: molybdopterin synthase sulfur carrier subunit [Lutibacter sp.]
MQLQLLFFGITSDITQKRSDEITISEGITIGALKEKLMIDYPKLKNYNSFSMALNTVYASDDAILNNGDIVALIPPVSGG